MEGHASAARHESRPQHNGGETAPDKRHASAEKDGGIQLVAAWYVHGGKVTQDARQGAKMAQRASLVRSSVPGRDQGD